MVRASCFEVVSVAVESRKLFLDGGLCLAGSYNNNNNNNGRNGSCLTWLATSLEEKRRWLIINAPHEDNVLNKFRIWNERHIQMRENRSSHLVG